jgi:hypothetical protein
LNACEGVLLQTVNAVVVQVEASQRGRILESVPGNFTYVVVVQLEMDQPLQIVKHPLLHNTDVIETDINQFQSLQSVESVS